MILQATLAAAVGLKALIVIGVLFQIAIVTRLTVILYAFKSDTLSLVWKLWVKRVSSFALYFARSETRHRKDGGCVAR
jgi:hypothetical protein